MKKIISIIFCVLLCALTLCGCGQKSEGLTGEELEGHPQVRVTMDDSSNFVIELYPEYAPETCANFLNLVNEGFYDGLTFHRIVDGFMAQGGSSDGRGIKGSERKIKGEFAANGFTQNTLKHERGVISMARTSDNYDSASSQFFICYSDQSFLDGNYAAFGKVIEGMETVDAFNNVSKTYNNIDEVPSVPVTPITIKFMEQIEGAE
ncbi:MAG: peptidylprolyl isomerase [Clostridia bacterium]|nr:peptidylprolyl isomerase [Clostridia bacterium]